jgi:hypothetical protein
MSKLENKVAVTTATNIGLALLGHDVVTSASTTWHLLFRLTNTYLAFYC